MLLSRPLTFFGGKGGVGKTTLAAAFSLASARAKRRTLLVSTDPAHSTSHLLGLDLGDEATEVEADLWSVEIDADAHAGRYIDSVAEDARSVVSPEILPTVARHLEIARSAPGMLESALLERFMDLMEQCPRKLREDRVRYGPHRPRAAHAATPRPFVGLGRGARQPATENGNCRSPRAQSCG